jgi:hypothetical protein
MAGLKMLQDVELFGACTEAVVFFVLRGFTYHRLRQRKVSAVAAFRSSKTGVFVQFYWSRRRFVLFTWTILSLYVNSCVLWFFSALPRGC